MYPCSSAQSVLPCNCNGATAVFEIFADGDHRRDAGLAGSGDDRDAVLVKLLVVDVAVRIDQASRRGKSGAASAVCVEAGNLPQARSESDQFSSSLPGLPSCC